jgi:hypothetical protein
MSQGPVPPIGTPVFPGGEMSVSTKAGGEEKIQAPRKADVLLGRGRPFQGHPGNQSMLRLVDDYKHRYFLTDRKGKSAIVEGVMKFVRERGGRFLRRVDYEYYWVEVTHSVAYRKVGHAFRSTARKTGVDTDSQNGADTPQAVLQAGSVFAGPYSSLRLHEAEPPAAAQLAAAHQLGGASFKSTVPVLPTAGLYPSLWLHEAEPPVAAQLAAPHQLGAASFDSPVPVLSTSGECNSMGRPHRAPPPLAMDFRLPLVYGHIGGLGGIAPGLSSFASPSPLLGGFFPGATEAELMHHQHQKLLRAQDQQQLLELSRRNMLLRQDQALQSELAHAAQLMVLESLRR